MVNLSDAASGSVTTVQKTQYTNGLVITFEAIAKGKCFVENSWQSANGGNVEDESTYAIFTIRSEDGSPFYGNQDGKDFTQPYQAPNFGYNLLLEGYAPNPSALIDHHNIFNYEENNVLYKAYDITDAVPFADKHPYIIINDGMIVSPDIMRIDKDGEFYFDEHYTGIRAMFDLNLNPALADPAKQAEVLERDPLFTYDEIVALFAEEGRSYDNYTPLVFNEVIDEDGTEPATAQ